jgi:hypothetical protein
MVVLGTVAVLVATASAAFAGLDYPPTSGTPTPGPNVIVTPGGGGGATGNLPFTGSDLTALWIGLVALAIGVVFVVATRRRSAMRRRTALGEAAA